MKKTIKYYKYFLGEEIKEISFDTYQQAKKWLIDTMPLFLKEKWIFKVKNFLNSELFFCDGNGDIKYCKGCPQYGKCDHSEHLKDYDTDEKEEWWDNLSRIIETSLEKYLIKQGYSENMAQDLSRSGWTIKNDKWFVFSVDKGIQPLSTEIHDLNEIIGWYTTILGED